MAGGWVAVVIILVIALIGGFIAAIFNSNGYADYNTSQIPNSEIILVAKAQIGNEGGDKFWNWKDENGNQDGTSDHVGIVTRTDITNRNIYTIEGNTSNKCAERMYSFDDVQVMGYGSPKYE